MIEETKTNPKSLKFKIGGKVRITKYNNIFRKDYSKNWSREIFFVDSVLETNQWTYKIKDLNGEKTIESFYEKELLLSKLLVSYYPEPDIHIRDKIKLVLDLSNYATMQALIHLI